MVFWRLRIWWSRSKRLHHFIGHRWRFDGHAGGRRQFYCPCTAPCELVRWEVV
jgi:hypothetical protein